MINLQRLSSGGSHHFAAVDESLATSDSSDPSAYQHWKALWKLHSSSTSRPSGDQAAMKLAHIGEIRAQAELRDGTANLRPTDASLWHSPSSQHRQSCKRQQRHCSGGRSWVSSQQACWSTARVVGDVSQNTYLECRQAGAYYHFVYQLFWAVLCFTYSYL